MAGRGAPRPWRPLRAVVLVPLAVACLRAHPASRALRVGTSGDYPPFTLARKEGLTGFDVAVARRFAHDSGRPLELVRFGWPELAGDLAAGRFDVAMGGITVRPERALVGTFTRPVLETAAVVLVRGEAAPTTADVDRPTTRLAVNAGGHLEQVARKLFPHALLVPSQNGALPELLRDGHADAVLTDDVEADVLAAALPDASRLGPLTHDRKAYLARDPALAAELDAWLRAREADGTLAELRARWFGASHQNLRSAFDSDLAALVALIDLRLALMPAVAAAKETAGLPVEDPAQEDRVIARVRTRARACDLTPESVEALFRAQLTAARAAEDSFLATTRAQRPAVPALDLQGDARPAIAAISDTIVERAGDLAADSDQLAGLDRTRLAELLDVTLAPLSARLAIATAVTHLQRTAPVQVPIKHALLKQP